MTAPADAPPIVPASRERLRIRVRGGVQGVGFRPFVHGLADRYGLSGFVLNDQEGVLAEVEGENGTLFLSALLQELPALARVDDIDVFPLPMIGDHGFTIRASVATGPGGTVGVPDAATCRDCVAELFDPASRFHLYPFITCVACGPRFTITRRTPYDRANTAMSAFALCGACAADYADPANRRFHAEAIACPACGPRLSHPVGEIAAALRQGLIVALKGVGGFHLLCDATNADAVDRLRLRKRRPARPFAIMVGDDVGLSAFAGPSGPEAELLRESARPIVLVRKGSGLADGVAPGLERVGVMLTSTPIHHLLFHALARHGAGAGAPSALVCTSANIAGEPLIIENEAAATALAGIADLIVSHDRAILQRTDDTVMAVIDGAPAFVRRARGFAPEPIELGEDGPSVLAVGAHLKATVCVTRGREAFVSQHVGDLDTAETVRCYEQTARQMLADLAVKPERVACDLHPDYRTTVFAETLGPPVLRIQHHAAHLAAVAAEHHLRGPLVGVALDGYGYGDDGSAWGGELMHDDGGGWRRVGHLRPLAMAGGDRAAREPWRMGVAAMIAVGRGDEAADRFPGQPLARALSSMVLAGGTIAETSSMGRLFDAAAALLGVRDLQSYEGQAAMELEALAGRPTPLPAGFHIEGDRLDFRPLLSALLRDGMTDAHGAALFHGTIIAGLGEWISRYAQGVGQTDIVLGGGCFMNRVLADGLARALRLRGLTPWLPRRVPANDGGISFGQAAAARSQLLCRRAA